MALFWVLVLAAAGGLVVWLASRLKGPSVANSGAALPGPTALDILKERYARGEITKSEYQEMRADIEA
ncbi:MAG: SHOCT domain-containing protein [Chloroflexi bacterium]|nr:SHOCT domain-containing protein [Chloroflexota bacterium]